MFVAFGTRAATLFTLFLLTLTLACQDEPVRSPGPLPMPPPPPGPTFDPASLCEGYGGPRSPQIFEQGTAGGAHFEDVTEAWGLPTDLEAITASAGDINGDSFADLLVVEKARGQRMMLFIGCAGGFAPIDLRERIDGDESDRTSHGATATLIADLNLDGKVDLALGDLDGALRVYSQTEGFRFTPWTFRPSIPPGVVGTPQIATMTPFDFDADGYLDLYLARRLQVEASTSSESQVPNLVMIQRTDAEGFIDLSDFAAYMPLRSCGSGLTCAATTFWARRAGVLTPHLWIANINGPSCVAEITPGRPDPTLRLIDIPIGDLGEARDWSPNQEMVTSMGVDVSLSAGDTDDDIAWVTESDWGWRAAHFRLASDGITNHTEDIQILPLPEGTGAFIGWGVIRRDLDNDGDEDLVIANGNYFNEIVSEGFFVGDLPHPRNQYLRYYENDGSGSFQDASSTAGLPFTTPGSQYSLAVADFDADGCYDLVAAPKDLSNGLAEGEDDTYDLGVRVLRNRCDYPNARYALTLPSGTIEIRLRATDGRVLVRPVRATSGVSATSETRRMVIGLPADFRLDSAEITRRMLGELSRVDLSPEAWNTDGYLEIPAPGT